MSGLRFLLCRAVHVAVFPCLQLAASSTEDGPPYGLPNDALVVITPAQTGSAADTEPGLLFWFGMPYAGAALSSLLAGALLRRWAVSSAVVIAVLGLPVGWSIGTGVLGIWLFVPETADELLHALVFALLVGAFFAALGRALRDRMVAP